MKLYGTVTSERASKGQGGNRYLDIDIFTTGPDKPTHHVHVIVSPQGDQIVVSLSALHFGVDKILAQDTVYINTPNEKGEKQKGETCPDCKQKLITDEEQTQGYHFKCDFKD